MHSIVEQATVIAGRSVPTNTRRTASSWKAGWNRRGLTPPCPGNQRLKDVEAGRTWSQQRVESRSLREPCEGPERVRDRTWWTARNLCAQKRSGPSGGRQLNRLFGQWKNTQDAFRESVGLFKHRLASNFWTHPQWAFRSVSRHF